MPRLLELGAGTAPWSRALLAIDPTVTSVAVDLPPVIAQLERSLSGTSLETRIDLIPQDVRTFTLTERFDVIVISGLCRLLGEADNARLFARCLDLLTPDGRLVICDAFAGSDDPDGSLALYSLGLAARSRAEALWSARDYERWLEAAGFTTAALVLAERPGMTALIASTAPQPYLLGLSDPFGPPTDSSTSSRTNTPHRHTHPHQHERTTHEHCNTGHRHDPEHRTTLLRAPRARSMVARRRPSVGAAWGADAGAVRPELRVRHGAVLRPLRHAARPPRRPPRPRLVLHAGDSCRRARHGQGASARSGVEGAGAAGTGAAPSAPHGVRHDRAGSLARRRTTVGGRARGLDRPNRGSCSRSTSWRSTTRHSPSRSTLALTISGDMIRRHFSLVGVSVAVGRLIAAGQRWGLTPGDIVPALQGSSPSSSASRAPLAELSALVADRHACAPPTICAPCRERAAQLVDGYLASYGWRPLAADVEAPTLAEHPDRLVDLVRSQSAATGRATRPDLFDELRNRVPASDRSEFDRLVDDARECYASLDDNSGITASTIGVLRRVVLEVGRRAQLRAALDRIDDVFNLTPAEVQVLAGGGSPVDAAALTERRRERIAAAHEPPPPVIGGPIVPPPDPSVFPGALGELAAAVGAYLGLKFTPAPDAERPALIGCLTVDGHPPVLAVPVVAGIVSGRIVVSNDPADALDRIEPGDILVCPYTTAAHNSIFPMLGGVVTQFGGPLGHTAVMAREFDIPAAVGAGTLPLHLDGRHGELAVDLIG